MTLNVEANMSGSRRLWTKIAQIAKMLEGMDDPTGDYMLSLEKRVDKLERDLKQLEGQLHSRPGGTEIQQ
jgi:polyhydroxyalkanoate synthesis regulator phasin